jgi:hypothetical protein
MRPQPRPEEKWRRVDKPAIPADTEAQGSRMHGNRGSESWLARPPARAIIVTLALPALECFAHLGQLS